jgi:hypothetical protein
MTNAVDERITTAIRVDHSTLNGQPAGSDTQYTVALSGAVGERWVEAFRAIQAESTAYRRFRLDPAGATISFSCRIVEGPTQVMEVLERLDTLLELVNGQVEL